MQRPGWEARWGDEEADRVAGAPAGAVAVAGAAAGFATAGGLDKTTNDATDAGRTAVSKSDDPLADEYLPNDVESLKSMVRAVCSIERQPFCCSGHSHLAAAAAARRLSLCHFLAYFFSRKYCVFCHT